MPSYDVEIIHYHTVNVQARDEDHAADLALDMESHGECWEMEVGEIQITHEDESDCCYSPYCASSPVSSDYVAYTAFSQSATPLRGTTLSNGYTTYC